MPECRTPEQSAKSGINGPLCALESRQSPDGMFASCSLLIFGYPPPMRKGLNRIMMDEFGRRARADLSKPRLPVVKDIMRQIGLLKGTCQKAHVIWMDQETYDDWLIEMKLLCFGENFTREFDDVPVEISKAPGVNVVAEAPPGEDLAEWLRDAAETCGGN